MLFRSVRQAVQETRGMVLTYGDNICDARFSKCCGGIAETFENCWAPIPHPYLVGLEDTPHGAVFNQEMTKQEAGLLIEQKDETCDVTLICKLTWISLLMSLPVLCQIPTP